MIWPRVDFFRGCGVDSQNFLITPYILCMKASLHSIINYDFYYHALSLTTLKVGLSKKKDGK